MFSVIKRNIVANVVGGIWTTLLNLVLIPFQARILGVEAYGLLSWVASLQIIFNIFDLGLSTTVVREIATDTSENYRESRALLQTINTGYWLIGLGLGIGLFVSARWFAQNWLALHSLSLQEVTLGLQIMAIALALRWPISMYMGVISGFQQMTTLNLLRILLVTVRLGGGLAVLFIWPSLLPFLVWQAISGFLEVGLYALACWRLLPGWLFQPRVSGAVLRRIWRFSFDINLISILAILFTQTDRLMVSKLLPLEMLGYYALAYNAAYGLSIIQGFITSAMLPALSADYRLGNMDRLTSRYSKATQALIYILTLPTFIFVFFGHDILRVWVSLEAAERTYQVLGLLAVGFLLNASVSNCYVLALATGHTELPLIVNAVAFLAYVLGLYFLIVNLGILGAALTWFLLNFYYLLTLLPLVQKRILRAGVMDWLTQNLLPFLLLGLFAFGSSSAVVHWAGKQNEIITWSACFLSAGLYSISGFLLLGPALRKDILDASRQLTVLVRSYCFPLRLRP